MSTLPSHPAHERPAPVGPVLVPFALGTLGTYLLLGALALAGLSGARWGLALVPVALVCFATAATPALRLLKQRP